MIGCTGNYFRITGKKGGKHEDGRKDFKKNGNIGFRYGMHDGSFFRASRCGKENYGETRKRIRRLRLKRKALTQFLEK